MRDTGADRPRSSGEGPVLWEPYGAVRSEGAGAYARASSRTVKPIDPKPRIPGLQVNDLGGVNRQIDRSRAACSACYDWEGGERFEPGGLEVPAVAVAVGR